MRVKICGITRIEDAMCALNNGCDALGFIFYKKSQRYIEPQEVKKIVDLLPPFVQKVGVFVDENPEEIDEISSFCKLDLAQIYPDRLSSARPQTPYIEVIRIKNRGDIQKLPSDRYFLVDAFVEQYGGEGQRVALEWFRDIECSKLILAGGIDIDNIDELKGFNFYGVDISSGVEISKGIKDCDKIREFIKKAKQI